MVSTATRLTPHDTHGNQGDVLEDEELDLLVPSARSSGPQDTSQHSASGSALGNSGRNPGSGSLGKKLDGSKEQRLGSSKVSRSTGLASGKSNSGEEGKSAGSGWGRRWDAHRQGILREFAVGGEKGRGPDQVRTESVFLTSSQIMPLTYCRSAYRLLILFSRGIFRVGSALRRRCSSKHIQRFVSLASCSSLAGERSPGKRVSPSKGIKCCHHEPSDLAYNGEREGCGSVADTCLVVAPVRAGFGVPSVAYGFSRIDNNIEQDRSLA